MTQTEDRMTLDLTGLVLTHGAHNKTDDNCCVMEAASIAACAVRDPRPAATWAEALTRFRDCKDDHPDGASWAIAAVLRSFNDWSGWRDDAERTAALKPFTLRLINSLASPEIEVKRALQAADWGLREKLAEVCEIVELPDHAATLRALAPLTGAASIRAATPAINRAALAALAALAARAARDARDARDARAARDARDARDARAALDARDAEYEAARKRRIQDACALIERMLAVTA